MKITKIAQAVPSEYIPRPSTPFTFSTRLINTEDGRSAEYVVRVYSFSNNPNTWAVIAFNGRMGGDLRMQFKGAYRTRARALNEAEDWVNSKIGRGYRQQNGMSIYGIYESTRLPGHYNMNGETIVAPSAPQPPRPSPLASPDYSDIRLAPEPVSPPMPKHAPPVIQQAPPRPIEPEEEDPGDVSVIPRKYIRGSIANHWFEQIIRKATEELRGYFKYNIVSDPNEIGSYNIYWRGFGEDVQIEKHNMPPDLFKEHAVRIREVAKDQSIKYYNELGT
jgi:hypothetical protein